MSVEKMIMVNMVGPINDLDKVCKAVVLSRVMQPISALEGINTIDFTIKATEENKEALLEVCYIKPYVNMRDYSIMNKKIETLRLMCTPTIGSEVVAKTDTLANNLIQNYEELNYLLDETIDKLQSNYVEIRLKRQQEQEYIKGIEHINYIKSIDVELSEIRNMSHFKFSLMKISRSNIMKLKDNYENIPAIIYSVYKDVDFEIVLSLTPIMLTPEADRIFKSLNCEDIQLPADLVGKPISATDFLKGKLAIISSDIQRLDVELIKISNDYSQTVDLLVKSAELEIKSGDIKSNIVSTSEFFYLCGWVPFSKIDEFKVAMNIFNDRLIIIEKSSEIVSKHIVAPTKLKNNFIVKPFEAVVRMYGIPTYGELDPTTFLSISYMLLFGAMFGDLGQGMIITLAGLYLQYFKRKVNLGGVLARLGISSSIFGLLYGSFFGFEHVIKPLLIRPMENIIQVLIVTVIFGCGLIIIGFIYSLINNVKRKDIENGLFGKDGLAGLLFYFSIIGFILSKYFKNEVIPSALWISLFIVLLGLILLKEPLANLISGKRPLYSVNKKDYFIEEGFGVLETILSILSNSLSFVRVGAFALNHVGLFLAFSALAEMAPNSIGSAFIYFLGNVVIIGLEGLIVFIQGLRLEYYELFSKYYDGAGIPFEPVTMSEYTKIIKR